MPHIKSVTEAWEAAMLRFIHARDYFAEHGVYPPYYGIEAFDDWVADIADAVLTNAGIVDRYPTDAAPKDIL